MLGPEAASGGTSVESEGLSIVREYFCMFARVKYLILVIRRLCLIAVIPELSSVITPLSLPFLPTNNPHRPQAF